MKVTNRRLDDKEFFDERKEVLAQWPTGKEVDLNEAIEYHKTLIRKNKNFARKLDEGRRKGEILVISDMGHTTIEQEIELLTHIQNEGHSDFLGTMVDSFTRNLRFTEAEMMLKRSEEEGKNLLNGFPIVCHGVKETRKVIDAVDLPVWLRYVTPTARLTTEIGLAAGHTWCEGHQMLCFMNYTKDDNLDQVVRKYQYIARLVGYYEEKGIPILSHPQGMNHYPGITPPSMILAGTIINLLMLPEQGVRNVWIASQSQGHLAQDVAYAMAGPRLGEEYLRKFGYNDVKIYSGSGEIPGRYPMDLSQAFAEVLWSPLVSFLAQTDLCHNKTMDEARGITTKEYSAQSLRGVKMMLRMLKGQKLSLLDTKELALELEMLEREAKEIIDKTLEIGDGDPIVGAGRAVEAGIIDDPVAPNPRLKGEIMGARDAEGAVRWLECPNLPFSKEVLEFNKDRLAQREKAMGKELSFDNVVEDILRISQPL
jgi:methylaspartate mutase epsilon subunit